MSTMERRTLPEIPEVVFQKVLFRYLPTNELLRLRRVCRRTKGFADRFLNAHSPYRTSIKIRGDSGDYGLSRQEVKEVPFLKTFLQQDDTSTIRIPTGRFNLLFFFSNISANQQLLRQKFVEKYANQLRHLELPRMQLPMETAEFEFYEELPNLKSLTISCLQHETKENVSNKKPGDMKNRGKIERRVIGPAVFPRTFLHLKTLKIETRRAESGEEMSEDFANLIRACKNLEYLRLPDFFCDRIQGYHGPPFGPDRSELPFNDTLLPHYPHNFRFQLGQLKTVLAEKKHRKLQFLDIIKLVSITSFFDKISPENLQLVFFLAKKYKLKLVNVQACFLEEMKFSQMEIMKPWITTVNKHFLMEDHFRDAVLPNVEQLNGLAWSCKSPYLPRLKKMFTPVLFPSLKKLEVYIDRGSGRSLQYVWSTFPNLEEVTIAGLIPDLMPDFPLAETRPKKGVGDLIFIGADEENPAFLNLKKLKVLSLSAAHELKGLTDATFNKVFRHMMLREFYLISKEGITSFTSAGIEALLSGEFNETIERFPFTSWKLEGMDNEEFHRLGGQFRCNKDV